MIAVADVTLNRVKSKKYPNTVCKVVTQGYTPGKLHGCQFSWYCDGKSDKPKNRKSFELSKTVAKEALNGSFLGATNGSTHYHAESVQPRWDFNKLEHTLTINNHRFYKYEI